MSGSGRVRLPLWCEVLVRFVARGVPRPRRDEWIREWAAELTALRMSGKAGRVRLLRHVLVSVADARQVRRLVRRPRPQGGAAAHLVDPDGHAAAPLHGSRWPRWQPLRSLRRAARTLARSPAFATASVLTLALGIGANTAIFSIVNAVALKPPAVREPQSLVRLYTSTPEGQPFGASSYAELEAFAAREEVFEGVVGYALTVGALLEDGRVEALLGEVVTGNYFRVLGVPMALGRGFSGEEHVTPGAHPVVVLGHGFWIRRFGADPGIVGRQLRLNGVLFDVIGVAAQEYRGLLPGIAVEFWAPAMMIGALMPDVPEALTGRQSRQFMAHARLRPEADLAAAQAAVSLVAERLAAAYPESNAGHTMTAIAAEGVRFHPRVDGAIVPVAMLLLCVPALVLLIACTNLAGLLLARATDRRKEIAVRLALGAGRRQVVGQLLGESLLLATLGGALGTLLATWMLRLMVSFKPPLLVSLSLDVGVDHRVLGFTVGVSLLAGVLFGLAPALRSSRPDLTRALRNEDAVSWRSRRVSLRDALLVGQVAISMLLLLVAGLFARSLQNARSIDPGFDTDASVVFSMSAAMRYDEAGGRAYYRQLLARVARIPGATSAALADRLPLGFSAQTMQVVVPDTGAAGAAPAEGEEAIDFARVSPGYFRTLGIELAAGRDFDARDTAGGAPVAIVSETAARRLWGDDDPLGRQIRRPDRLPLQVVGVARDTRVRSLGEAARPLLYVPFEQSYESAMELIIATDRDPTTFLAVAQEAILQVDAEVIPLELMTMADGNDVILFPVRAAAWTMGAFGLLALLLSAVGIVGALAYAVARRGQEVGVRLALGATPGGLVAMVVAGGMRRVAAGMLLGAVLALAAGRLFASLLVGVSPADPTAFAVVSALLMVVAGLASYLPARRIVQADPLSVMREE